MNFGKRKPIYVDMFVFLLIHLMLIVKFYLIMQDLNILLLIIVWIFSWYNLFLFFFPCFCFGEPTSLAFPSKTVDTLISRCAYDGPMLDSCYY